jgi:multidrug transporter EmrE-like cation transporter
MVGYFFIVLTIFLTVYGQLIIKWQVGQAGAMPVSLGAKLIFLLHVCLNPWVVSGFAAAFLASICWIAAMTKFNLSHAYPFMGLSFVLVLIGSGLFFGESITPLKIAGTALIVLGIIVASQG